MAVALVQTAYDVTQPWTPSNPGTVTFASPLTSGNTVVVCTSVLDNRTVVSVTDHATTSNTYTERATGINTAEAWIHTAPVTQANTVVSVAFAGTTTSQGQIVAMEFSGLNNADLLEQAIVNNADSTSPYNTSDIANVTTTVADSLLVGVIQSSSAADYTNDATFALPDAATDWNGGLTAYKILTATTTTESWDVTSAAGEVSIQLLVALNGTAAGGGTVIPVIIHHLKQQGLL